MTRLQPVEPILTLRILALLATSSAALRVFKVRTVIQGLTPGVVRPKSDLRDVQRVVRHLDGLLRRAPVLPRGHCLLRSLTLYYFCTRLGYPVRISFGTRLNLQGQMEAHGWLVLEGRPFMERGEPDAGYVTVWQYPQAAMGETA